MKIKTQKKHKYVNCYEIWSTLSILILQEIPLPNVKSNILAKVIEFAQHHKIEPMNEIEKVSLQL